ncbi:hybrid sensor histidine kinase/response regulator [Skermanella stibiiresistens]|uniref:hybrid sensor histidine kinase/response regulator n=1 Tax=Skermanella stibiiresistens TaxID=913326 RepID=UPI0012FCF357|nr:response regulator [Skermanella stibiiresistens]
MSDSDGPMVGLPIWRRVAPALLPAAVIATVATGLMTAPAMSDWITAAGSGLGLGLCVAVLVAVPLARALALTRSERDAAKRDGAEVTASLERLRRAIDSVPGGFVLRDRDGKVVFASTGYGRFHPDLEAIRETAGETIVSGPENHQEDSPWEETLRDGRVLLVDRRRTGDGGVVRVYTDITAQKQAEHLLRHRLTALEASIDGVAILDQAGAFTYLNDSHARMHGFDGARDVMGRSWLSLYSAAERARLKADALPRLIDEGRWRGEAIGRRRDGGTFAQELTLTGLDDGGMVYIVRDISERRRAEVERARLTEQFHQAQKLEAIGRLAGGIAHDFNNILAAMMGYASFLVEDLDPAAPEHEFAMQLMVAGERAKRLVQQILAFSRSEGIERETVNMIAVLDETVALLRATLPKSINLVSRVDAVSALVHANPTQMSQVLMNLCVNAADAIGGGPGELSLEIDMPSLDGGYADGLRAALDLRGDLIPARIGPGERPGSTRMWVGVLPINQELRVRYVRITVGDTGTGMPLEVMERMLEPFYTTKGVGKGTGLGLAAVHGIVSSHRGAMMIESVPGEGTRFQVYLPTLEGAVIEQAQSAANSPRGTERILIVDDEDMVSSVVAQGLERLGYEVACCVSADEALSVITEEPGAWDMVISDQMMPGMSGQELAERLRADHPRLPVILCSGYGDPVAEFGLDPEIGQILIKPVEAGHLAETVRKMLDQR